MIVIVVLSQDLKHDRPGTKHANAHPGPIRLAKDIREPLDDALKVLPSLQNVTHMSDFLPKSIDGLEGSKSRPLAQIDATSFSRHSTSVGRSRPSDHPQVR